MAPTKKPLKAAHGGKRNHSSPSSKKRHSDETSDGPPPRLQPTASRNRSPRNSTSGDRRSSGRHSTHPELVSSAEEDEKKDRVTNDDSRDIEMSGTDVHEERDVGPRQGDSGHRGSTTSLQGDRTANGNALDSGGKVTESNTREKSVDAGDDDLDSQRAYALCHMVNFLNARGHANLIGPDVIFGVQPRTAEAITAHLLSIGCRLGTEGPNIIRSIWNDPSGASTRMEIVEAVNDSADDTQATIEKQETEAAEQDQDFHDRINTDNETGQWCQQYEEIYQDKDTGAWMIRFTKDVRGKTYEQVDELPSWDDSKAPYKPASKGDCGTYIRPKHEPVPLYHKSDKGTWVQDAGNPWEWKRHYTNPTAKDVEKMKAVAKPKFVVRTFDRNNGRYMRQYFYGQTWAEFDKHVADFDMNKRKHAEDYNRWLRQVHERNGFEYQKRATREPWKSHELMVLNKHFADIIEEHGIIHAHLTPELDDALNKINEARKAKDARGAPRNLSSVRALVDRAVFPSDVPDLGIAEWREFGLQLLRFQQNNPGITVDKGLLMPKNAIPLDHEPDKQATGTQQKNQGPKLTPIASDGKLKIVDRFGGALVAKIFGVHDSDQTLGSGNKPGDKVQDGQNGGSREAGEDTHPLQQSQTQGVNEVSNENPVEHENRPGPSKRKRASTDEEEDMDDKENHEPPRTPKRTRQTAGHDDDGTMDNVSRRSAGSKKKRSKH